MSNQTPWTSTVKGEPSGGTPIFLRKTYDMINTCDDTIAAWDDGGKAIVVKDTERFSAEVIPDYFKHNNFSSFVRQLNFYGFRKIKSGSIRIADAASSEETRNWKFRHEKFQRGRPELLAEIRKSSCENAEKLEVEHLKSEVQDLKGALASVTNELADLKAQVGVLIPGEGSAVLENGTSFPGVASKKFKGTGEEYLISVPSCDHVTQAARKVLPTSANAASKKCNGMGEEYLISVPSCDNVNQAALQDSVVLPTSASFANTSSWTSLKSLPPDATLRSLAGNFPMSVPPTTSLTPLPVAPYDAGSGNSEWPDMSHVQVAPGMNRNGSFGSLTINEDALASLLDTEDPDFSPAHVSAARPTNTYQA